MSILTTLKFYSGTDYNIATDELKNVIGNLTILGALDNSTIGNNDFSAKRPILKKNTSK